MAQDSFNSLHSMKFSDIKDDEIITIAAGIDVIIINENEAVIKYGARSIPSVILRDNDSRNVLGSLLKKLKDDRVTQRDLSSELDIETWTDLKEILADLHMRGIITKASNSITEQYLSFLFQKASGLSKFTVTIVGLGVIGTELAADLSRSGLGKVLLYDGRTIQRDTFPYLRVRKKADKTRVTLSEAAALHLQQLGNNNIEVLKGDFDDMAAVRRAFMDSDFLVMSLDRPNPRIYNQFNRIALQTEKRWMISTIDGDQGYIGPTFIPFHTACYGDFERQFEASLPNPQTYKTYKEYLNKNKDKLLFTGLPSYAKILSGMTSLSIIHQLVRDYSFTTGRSIVIDFERMLFDTQDILRLPRCPFCREKFMYTASFPPHLRTAT
jgi:thiazole/oxazole-forming peptide maturase SagC family component